MERLRADAAVDRFVRANARLVRQRITEAVGTLVRAEAAVTSISPPSLTISHLIPREAVATYRSALSALHVPDIPSVAVVRGPNAPFSFVTVDER
jgi:hypothetical protein